MDIIDLLANDERIIVYSSKEDRSIVTWNQSDTLQWWRPIVRMNPGGYSHGFSPNDWEEVALLTQSGYGPKSYGQARKVAIAWLTNSL